jgi:hypothetical protein
MIKSTFREWTLDKIDEAFGLEQVASLPILKEWLAYKHEVTDFERQYLLDLQDTFLLGGDDWNEVELENKFISPLIVFSKMDNRKFAYFLERELKATVNDYELSGKVDGMIASGFRNPKKPFFCMNEYKRESDPSGDPKGQALIAMLVAQQLNEINHQPVYGSYIVGKLWRFIVLQDKQYAFSKSLTADGDDIFDIYRIIKGLRHQIEKLN